MTRVVILSGVYPEMRCGVSLHVKHVAQTLSERGTWEVHVLTSDHAAVDEATPRGFELHPVISRWNLIDLPRVLDRLRALDPEILHVMTPTAVTGGRIQCLVPLLGMFCREALSGGRLVVTQHDLAIGHPWMQRKHGLLLRRADAVTVSNDRDYRSLLRLSGNLRDKSHWAPSGPHFSILSLPEDERESMRTDLGVPEGGVLASSLGFVSPGRRTETLIRSVCSMASEGWPLRLCLMGDVGPGHQAYLARCKALARSLAPENVIVWLGYVDAMRVRRILAASDVFVSAIERGADFRNSSIAAAIHATVPVLTTENPRYGISDELRQSGTCRFFDPKDPKDLTRTMSGLLKDVEELARMRRACREASQWRTWERHAQSLERAYRGEPPEIPESFLSRRSDR